MNTEQLWRDKTIMTQQQPLDPKYVHIPRFRRWTLGYSEVFGYSRKRIPKIHVMLLDNFEQGLFARYKGDPLCVSHIYPLKQIRDAGKKITCTHCIDVLKRKGWIKHPSPPN